MNTTRLPSQRSGLRVSIRFNVRNDCASVHYPADSAIVCDQLLQFAQGQTGYIYHTFGIARAFWLWLAPAADSSEVKRAQWASVNPETGEVEADIYPEFVADVIAKIRRLKAREFSCHSVSL